MIKQTLFCLTLLAGLTANATSHIVVNTDDSGTGSFRDQVAAAVSGDTILFDPVLDGSTIVLTTGQINIDKALVILGPGYGNLTISGNMSSRILNCNGGDVYISGLTFMNGNLSATTSYDGGAIKHYTMGNLTLKNVHFISNDSRRFNGGSQAGALYYGVGGGKLFVDSCYFSNNMSDDMGGALTCSGRPLRAHIRNSWFDANMTTERGGAMVSNADTLLVENCTFSNNNAKTFASVELTNNYPQSSMWFINSTFSNNMASNPYRVFSITDGELGFVNSTFYLNNEPIYIEEGPNSDSAHFIVHNSIFHNYGMDLQIYGDELKFTSLGGNVCSDTSMNFLLNQTNDTTEVAPMIYPLADNGGLMHTHALMKGSPAIKNGTAGGPQLDQLGNTRTYLDAGALDFICPVATSTDIQTSCGAFTWMDGNTYTTSNNTATFLLVDAAASGCDSVITLNLTVNSLPDNSTSRNGRTLTATATSATYAWLDCNNNFSPLANETSQSFTVNQSGDYAVEVTENGCKDTSECVNVDLTGISDAGFASGIRVYPNPTEGMIILEFAQQQNQASIELQNVRGQVLNTYSYSQVSALQLELDQAPGIYFLVLRNERGEQAIFKIVHE